MQDFRRLNVWQAARRLAGAVYRVTHAFPREELFGMTSQMRRCAVSIGSNIAEGCGRFGHREFRRFLSIAAGSASELEHQLLLAQDLDLISTSESQRLIDDVQSIRRMLVALHSRVGEQG